MSENTKNVPVYTVAIIGGGASGTALLYTLARYTNIASVVLLEKHAALAQVNSNAKNNSQTLHTGDIETNYSVEKVRSVRPAAMMLKYFTDGLDATTRAAILTPMQKMVLAVGTAEAQKLKTRYEALKKFIPEIEFLDAEGIARLEPEVMRGRPQTQAVAALYNPQGYAVNFANLANTFVNEAQKIAQKTVDVFLNRAVSTIIKDTDGLYTLNTAAGPVRAQAVVVDADAYSLGFAKAMGYGHEFSLIPIAGTFFFSNTLLRGKVYTMQEERLPFAAAHGDPDVNVPNKTRWGPTAQFWPVLESRKLSTAGDYFRSSGLMRWRTWKSFAVILSEPVRFWYLLKNILYILPFVGKYFFVRNVQKIVPSVRGRDLTMAKGFGGMRLQRVDIHKNELLLGEGKIIGDNIIFNMTPSPGASVCLYNAMRDAQQLSTFLADTYTFDKQSMLAHLAPNSGYFDITDVSQKQSYSS